MKNFILFFYLLLALPLQAKTICLNMIVKNEASVIERCLNSVKPHIDYWVIVDTGSTDGTQEIIKRCMKGVPGEFYEKPWVNFGHNRDEALQLAKEKGDYVLFIDADEELKTSIPLRERPLNLDYYLATIRLPKVDYERAFLINQHLRWAWQDPIHECLICKDKEPEGELLTEMVVLSSFEEGYRAQDERKFHKDAAILEELLKKEPDHPRYLFYLGQSYFQAQELEKALKTFEKRAQIGGWDQEVFWSLYAIGLIQELLKMPLETLVQSYSKAYAYRPTRAEPLFRLANLFFRQQNYTLSYAISKFALTLPVPLDRVYVEKWVYDYGLFFSAANAAFGLKKYEESISLYQKVLVQNVEPPVREEVEKNLMVVKSCLPAPSDLSPGKPTAHTSP